MDSKVTGFSAYPKSSGTIQCSPVPGSTNSPWAEANNGQEEAASPSASGPPLPSLAKAGAFLWSSLPARRIAGEVKPRPHFAPQTKDYVFLPLAARHLN